MMPELLLAECLGPFRPQAASAWFSSFTLYSPSQIEAAAKAAAHAAGRRLLSPMTRSAWEAVPGDRSLVWKLSGEPALVAKVCATDDAGTARMWRRLADVSARLQPPEGLEIPRVRFAGDQPIPWCVIDAAAGSPALLESTGVTDLFKVVLAVQRTKLEGFQFRATWGASTYVKQVEEPVRQLVAAEVIGAVAGRRALALLAEHRPHLKELSPVTAHNDLTLYHIYTGGPSTWVIDWESAIRDRLHMLDVAHLIVNHGAEQTEWARELAGTAMEYARGENGDSLRSNLVVSLLERATGKALDLLRRRHQQSTHAVEALCGVLDDRFVPA
jgi:hypothetical protein